MPAKQSASSALAKSTTRSRNPNATQRRAATIACLLLIAVCAVFAHRWPQRTHAAAAPNAAPAPPQKPNIVFILTDDLATNLLAYMPSVQAMQREGTTFSNYFVTDSLCCPSRSSIFTGKFPHNTGVFTNQPPDGGYETFNSQGNESHTFAVALQHSGYKTAMLGKYLNGYAPRRNGAPPGWNEWDVAGAGYPEFNYALNQNGRIVPYGNSPDDYLTDVVARLGQAFMHKSAGHPYFIEIATFAPHAPYIPAPRDADKFPGLTAPRTTAYAARPDANAPAWLKAILPLRPGEMLNMNKVFPHAGAVRGGRRQNDRRNPRPARRRRRRQYLHLLQLRQRLPHRRILAPRRQDDAV